MTAGSQDEEQARSGLPQRSDRAQAPNDIEAQIEKLAEEMGRLIDDGPQVERESLRAYAVSLLRERVPSSETIEEDESIMDPEDPPGEPGPGSNSATLIGYGFLLLPASAVLLLVFPPVGGMLFVTGVVLMASGLAWAMVSKLVRSLAP